MEKTLGSPLDCKEIQPVHPKGNQSWIFIRRIDAEAETSILATWCEKLTPWKRPWCWGRFKAGEGENRGWDGWMSSPTWRAWVWVSSGGWWWTVKPGVLLSMGSQRVRYNWATELRGFCWRRKWQPTVVPWLEIPLGRGAWQAIVHRLQRVWHDWSDLAEPSVVPHGISNKGLLYYVGGTLLGVQVKLFLILS